MKKTFLKHLLLTISLCLVLYVFLKSVFLDKMTLFVFENLLTGGGLYIINYTLIVETTLTIINNISKLILIIIAFACFIPHVILLDAKKKKKIIICILTALIFGLFLIIRLEPIYDYIHQLITQLLRMSSSQTSILLIISSVVSCFTLILTNLLKLVLSCLSLVVLIIYIKTVDINGKFKKTILVLSIITAALYIFGNILCSFLGIYNEFCRYIKLPSLYYLLGMLPLPHWMIYQFSEFILLKSMYVLPFLMMVVLFISSIVYLIVSCKNNLPDKYKKLYIILLIPFILTVGLFVINFTLRLPLFLLLILKFF